MIITLVFCVKLKYSPAGMSVGKAAGGRATLVVVNTLDPSVAELLNLVGELKILSLVELVDVLDLGDKFALVLAAVVVDAMKLGAPADTYRLKMDANS
jgi:hypothetical protein